MAAEPHAATPAPTSPRNGTGRAALVLGIIAAASALLSVLLWLLDILDLVGEPANPGTWESTSTLDTVTTYGQFAAVLAGIAAIANGMIGHAKVRRGEATNRAAARWGFWLGLASIVLIVATWVTLVGLLIYAIVS